MKSLSVLALAWAALQASLLAQGSAPQPASPTIATPLTSDSTAQSISKEKKEEAMNRLYRWVNSYYKSPTTDDFVSRVRLMAELDLLKNEESQYMLLAFLSEIMAAHPTKVKGWLEELKTIDQRQIGIINAAAWYSGSKEAQAYFKEHHINKSQEETPPKINELKAEDIVTVDMLWGSFLATGSPKPVRSLVDALGYSIHEGALERYKGTKVTKEQQLEINLDALYRAVESLLEGNMRSHPKLLAHCRGIMLDPELAEAPRHTLHKILQRVSALQVTQPEAFLKE